MRALDASTEIVNGFAEVVANLHAAACRVVVKITGVAFGAVEVSNVLKAASSIGGLRGYQRKAEANRECHESFSEHVVCKVTLDYIGGIRIYFFLL